ncbi:hypothetical protein GCM10009789_02910 [Kribbella sancticallisti]|uniref:Integral membrane protein n=1 Tax=Kribbella sancticallisti TaxID=460087 RepID=A0ABN2C8P3_9ACTN
MSDVVRNEPSGGLAADERAELARLRAEVASYRRDHDRDQRGGRGRWRSVVAVLLIVIGCLLMPVSVVGVWARNQITDTERYVANVAPLASDPDVQNALTDRITAEVFRYVDVAAITNQAVDVLAVRGLPPVAANQLRGLSGVIAAGVRGFVRDKVGEVVASNQFRDAWVTANRVAHAQLIKALSGEGGAAVSVSEGRVSVDLGAFVAAAKQRLVEAGFTAAERIPAVNPQFELFASRDLARAQTGYRLVERLGTALPFVAIGLIVLGVYVARNHRRALVGAGLGVAAAMLLLGAGITVGRTIYLERIPEDVLSTTTAATVFDTLVRFIRDGLRTVLVVGLVVAAAAFVSGHSVTAVRTRHGFTTGIGWLRRTGEAAGLRTGPVGSWAHANLTVLRIVVVGLAAVVFVFWDRPTGKTVLLLAVFVVVALAVLEFLARPPHAGEPAV